MYPPPKTPERLLPLEENDRRLMLSDIARIALHIGRDLYPEMSLVDNDVAIAAPSEGRSDICPRERLGFLENCWSRLENAIRHLEKTPDTQLTAAIRSVPLERARRVAPKELLTALQRRTPLPLVREQVTVPSVDTPANRLVKTILATVVRDLRQIAELARVVNTPEIAARAFRLLRRVRSALCRPPWQTLSEGNVDLLPLRVRNNGAYRLLYDTFRQYRRGFALNWNHPVFHLPARDLWILYEYWCLFQVANALRELGFQTQFSDGFLLSRGSLTFTLAKGRASCLTFRRSDGICVNLYYSREFAGTPDRDGFFSRSHTMRPDILLECAGNLLVLDAKFKTYAEIGELENLPLTADVNQCHAYRDGIRQEGRSVAEPSTAAWLLYPGVAGRDNRRLISYRDPGIGALLLRPGNVIDLRPFLEQWLQQHPKERRQKSPSTKPAGNVRGRQ